MPSCVGRCCWLLIALFLSLCFFLCVSQFLAHWDGLLTSTCTDVVVIGATNRLHDIDAAALRRFARQFEVPLPDLQGRQAILTCLLAKENLGASVNLAQIAAQTPSFSGADLKELCRYACHLPMRELMVHSSAPTSPLPASSPAQPASAGRGSGPLASGSSPSQPSAAAEQPAPAPSVSLASGSAFSATICLLENSNCKINSNEMGSHVEVLALSDELVALNHELQQVPTSKGSLLVLCACRVCVCVCDLHLHIWVLPAGGRRRVHRGRDICCAADGVASPR